MDVTRRLAVVFASALRRGGGGALGGQVPPAWPQLAACYTCVACSRLVIVSEIDTGRLSLPLPCMADMFLAASATLSRTVANPSTTTPAVGTLPLLLRLRGWLATA
jgi:hypothetical protein